MVTGLLRKHVFVRRQFWTGFWPISNGEGFKIGLRLAFGRPETDFEVSPLEIGQNPAQHCIPYYNLIY
jgi:hypothetical protein